MKKILFFATALAGLFLAGSCQRENLEPAGNTVTYTVQLADAVGTKAALGDDISAVDQLVYEVWRTQGTKFEAFDAENDKLLYQRTAKVDDGVATIELEFVNDQNFIVLFWAQTERNGVYDATKLTEVKITSPDVANNPNAQAFVGRDFVRDCVSDLGGKVTLTRPVAQLNIGTTYASLDAFNPGNEADVTITGSSVKVTGLATSYNIATLSAGEASTVAYEYNYNGDSCPLPIEPLNVNGTDYKYVAMNYVGFPAKDGSNVTVTYVINTSEGNIVNEDAPIENVPVKANYRTNIIGNLITSKTDYIVTLDNNWADEEYYGPEFVKEPKYNAQTKTYTVVDALELKWVAQQVNTGKKSFKGETVQLAADIDLKNEPWTPIGYGGKHFQGTFEGVALTRVGNDYPTISNLFIENGEYAGLFGTISDGGLLRNFNLNHVSISGSDYLGAVLGRIYTTVDNVTVTDAEITAVPYLLADGVTYDGGAKVGGIAGLVGDSATITNCTVKNSTFKAYRDMGGIVGTTQYDYPTTLTGNSVEDLTFIVTGFYTPYNGNDKPGHYAPIRGGKRSNAGDVIKNNTGDDIELHKVLVEANEGAVYDSEEKVYIVTSPAGLAAALLDSGAADAGSHTIQINGDLDMTGMDWTPINVDGYNGAEIVTVEGNGATIKGLDGALFEGGFGGCSGIVIKDLTIEDAHMIADNTLGYGAFVNCTDSMVEITLVNCHLKNSTIITPNDGAAESRIGGLVGWTAGYNKQNDGPVDSYITIQNCSVTGCTLKGAGSIGGICGHAGANAATFTKIENCTVTDNTLVSTDDGDWRVGAIVGTANNGQCEINNVTVSGNTISQVGKTAEVYQSELYGRFVPDGTGTLTINGTAVSTTTPVLVNGYTALYTADGEYFIYNLAGFQDLHTFFSERYKNPFDKVFNIAADIDAEGYTWASIWLETGNNNMKGSIINGNGHSIKNLTITGGAMFGGTPNGKYSDVPMTIKNLTIDSASVTEGPHFNAVFWGTTYGDVAFENVVVKNSEIGGNCNVGAFVGGTALEGTATAEISFKDCAVNGTTLTATGATNPDPTGASGFIGRAYGKTSLKFEGTNTIDEATTITNNNSLVGGRVYGYTTLYGNGFTGTGACDTFTDFAGVEVVKVGDNVYGSFAAAVANAKTGDKIELLSDVTLAEETEIPAGVTLKGNGNQINGSIYAGGDLTFEGHTKVTSFSASYYNRTITIGEDACLEVTGSGRVSLAYGNTFNITGSIENAKTADKANVQPSLIIPGGISITGGSDATLNVTNAYVQIGSTTSKNNEANGVFTLNFINTIAEFTNQLTFAEPTSGKNPTFNLNVTNSVLTTGTKLVAAAPNSNVNLDNSVVTLATYFRNSGEFNVANGSVLTGATIQFGENGGNDGTIKVDNSTLTVKASSTGDAFDGRERGSITLTNGANATVTYYKDMTITNDETSTFTGTKVQ